MSDIPVAVVVSVPEKYFPDDDDTCLTAGKFVCGRLESHLIQHGHKVADWIHGGCEEDWGVYFESQKADELFDYNICFFPDAVGKVQCLMVVQYHLKVPFLKRLFKKPRQLGMDHHMHHTMREFGSTFTSSRILTQSQFDAEI